MKSATGADERAPAAPPRWVQAPILDFGRTVLAHWLLHPAESLASVLFVLFLTMSLTTLHGGSPESYWSLRYSALYGLVWVLWLVMVEHVAPPSWGWLQTLRGAGPWVAVMLSYNLVRFLIPAVHPARLDDLLRHTEVVMGLRSARFAHALHGHPHWTDFFAAVYLCLFAWMVSYVALYVLFRRGLHQRFITGFVLIYAGGFVGYMIFPATGPRYAYPAEWSWLSGGFAFALCNRVISNMGAKLDVFPSLHAALSIYLMSWQVRHHPRNLLWGLPLTVAIWLSTIFLGFHYAPDLLAGGILGVGSALAAPRLEWSFISLGRHVRPGLPPTGAGPGKGTDVLDDRSQEPLSRSVR